MKKRLGKSLESILDNKPREEDSSNSIVEIDVENIAPNPFQPRKNFVKEKINELALSIKESGLLQPIVVFKGEDDIYYIIVGERRWRAVHSLKWKKIPAIIKDFDDKDKMVGALVENIQRENLNAVEIAEGIDQIVKKLKLTHEEASKKIGINRSTLSNYLRLLFLPEAVKEGIIRGEITQGHARALLSLKEEDILTAFSIILKNKLSVRHTESMVRLFYKEKELKEEDDDVNIKKTEEKIAKKLSTKVLLKYSKKGKGKIEIYFNSLDEFDRLYNIIDKGGKE